MKARELYQSVGAQVSRVIVGQEDSIRLMFIALLGNGHILLEGTPGTAKTLMARAFAASCGLQFGRIQFTPDLMPGDIIGANLFDFKTSTFTLKKGPVFCDLLVADEINRTPPKTQAALLEAMQESSVTIDGQSHMLGDNFTVIATQNPIEQQGTYPLPEAQLDRFLFKHVLAYPDRDAELQIVARHGQKTKSRDDVLHRIDMVVSAESLAQARTEMEAVRLQEDVIAYMVDLVRATRENSAFEVGASPRAAAAMAIAARAEAAVQGRDYVVPDDVKSLALPLLRHRVVLSPAAEIEGKTAEEMLQLILTQTEAPR